MLQTTFQDGRLVFRMSLLLVNLFLYLWLCWVSIAMWAFLQLQLARATLHCGGRSWCRARPQGVWACRFSSCGSPALERGLGSCGTGAQVLCSMWDLPRAGIQPASPALAGGFFTTEPPGKPWLIYFEITTQVSDFF